MRYPPVTGVQPSILKWARESIGLSVADVSLKLKKEEDIILAWESGQSAPTYAQLEKLAYDLYKRPLAVFFLPNPPQENLPEMDFRTLPDADFAQLHSDTYIQIRKAHAFQISLNEVFDGQIEKDKSICANIKLDITKNIHPQAVAIREFLGVSLEVQKNWKSVDQALREWRERIENAGVFVFKAAFKQKEISGFCLYQDLFPIIYLNNSTTKTRQIFSLMHELAHLLLHLNSLSKFDKSYFNNLSIDKKAIEVFCNKLAAQVLIPPNDFERESQNFTHYLEHNNDRIFERLAARYSVSREVILRLLLDAGKVPEHYYSSKSEEWKSQQKKRSGGNYYATTNAYLSQTFAQAVVGLHYQNRISVLQAADYLGINAKSFAGIEQMILSRGNG